MADIWTQTLSGAAFPLLDPRPEDVNFVDMAHQLARMDRFNGGAQIRISVGRHSMNVAKAMHKAGETPEMQLRGLLHDGKEYAIGDIINPVKALLRHLYGSLEPLNRAEAAIDAAIFEAAGLPPDPDGSAAAVVAFFDTRMLATEKAELLAVSARPWGALPARFPSGIDVSKSADEDAADFLEWLAHLSGWRQRAAAIAAEFPVRN